MDQRFLDKDDVVVELDMVLDFSENLQIYVDDEPWDGTGEISTMDRVDFRDMVDNELLFYLP